MRTETLNQSTEALQPSHSGRTESKSNLVPLFEKLETEFITFVSAESALFESVSRVREFCLDNPKAEKRKPNPPKPSPKDLEHSIKRLESSHRRLMSLLNDITTVLSDTGT